MRPEMDPRRKGVGNVRYVLIVMMAGCSSGSAPEEAGDAGRDLSVLQVLGQAGGSDVVELRADGGTADAGLEPSADAALTVADAGPGASDAGQMPVEPDASAAADAGAMACTTGNDCPPCTGVRGIACCGEGVCGCRWGVIQVETDPCTPP